MTNDEKLLGVEQVYFHASCPDGTAAAMIIATAFACIGIETEFIPLQYNTDFMNSLKPQRGQLFVDITPPKDRWEEWIQFEPIVLDHHGTAKHIVLGLNGVYGENETHSGAKLAFDEIFMKIIPSQNLPPRFDRAITEWKHFAEVAMVRDTWKNTHSLWQESIAQSLALSLFGSEHLIEECCRENVEFSFTKIREVGNLLLENNTRQTEKIAKGAYRTELSNGKNDVPVAIFNCTEKLVSDVGNYLIEDGVAMAVGYFYMFEDNRFKMCCSVRTNSTVSASDIAQFHGGGGHPRAAGFTLFDTVEVSARTLLDHLWKALKNTSK